MQPWPGLPRRSTQPELAQKEKEGLIHGRVVQALTAQRDKQTSLDACQFLATIKVESQLPSRRWMKCHKPTFSKLRFSDVECLRTDVIDLQGKGLRDPQSARRYQPKQRVERMRPQGPRRRQFLGFREDCGDLGGCEDVG
jgi:hypothetical protein